MNSHPGPLADTTSTPLQPLRIGLAQISQQVGQSYYFPYSVGLLQAFILKHAPDPGRYQFLPPVYQRLTVAEALTAFANTDVVGFSLYVWNVNRSLHLAAALKQQDPQRLIIVGGPQVPDAAEAFLREYPQIDLCVHGPGERALLAVLERWPARDWASLAGLSWLDGEGRFHSTPPAPRESDLSVFPSPYLEGVFDPLLAENEHWIGLLETNRGCPFACTFCDWGSAIQSKVYRFPLERVYAEIDWIAYHRVGNVFTCDANFGILPRDLEIAHHVAARRRETGFPLSFQNQTSKNTPERVIAIQQILHEAGLATYAAISLQSVDPHTLASIRRDNISLAAYAQVQAAALKSGILAYTDMILALPGESYASFTQGIDSVIRHGQHTKILYHNATLLPNAEMAAPEYRQRFGLETARVSLPGHTPATDGLPELMEIIVASATLNREQWVRLHVFAWFSAFLYYTHKLLQPALLVVQSVSEYSWKELFEAFMYAPAEDYPVIGSLQADFERTARNYQQGYPRSQQDSLIWTLFDGMYLTPDNSAQIQLWNSGLIDAFYNEAGLLLGRLMLARQPHLDLRLLEDALSFNRRLFLHIFSQQRFPVEVAPRPLPTAPVQLHYNLPEFYQGILHGEPVVLREVAVYPVQL